MIIINKITVNNMSTSTNLKSSGNTAVTTSVVQRETSIHERKPPMSVSTLFDLLLLFGAYQLGSYNARHPGDMAMFARFGWVWAKQLWK
jgi:hypothetical protein